MGARAVRGTQRRQSPGDLDDVIYGIHAVDEALAAGEALRHVHIGLERRADPAVRPIVERARAAGVSVRYEERAFFGSFPYRAHQSVVAFGAPFGYISLAEAIGLRSTERPGLWVVLDHVTDPHNLGAIMRTAESAGATALILPERRAAGVNATVRKAAAGAAAHVAVARVANIAQSVRAFKQAAIWTAGAALGPTSVPYTQADLTTDVALVIGAEGTGVSPLVQRECDYLVKIPMHGRIASLNASVACGVLLYETLRQRAQPKPAGSTGSR